MTTLSKFCILLLPPTLTPIPRQPHSCHKRRVSKSAMTSGGCELCPGKAAGNKSSWKSEAWRQLPSTIILSISSPPQDAIPGYDRRPVLCTRLFPAMHLSAGLGGESGNEVAMTSGSGVSL